VNITFTEADYDAGLRVCDNNNFGELCTPAPAALGDRVWLDQNANGIQDAGEPGVPNVVVNLRDCAGTILATTTTDANGLYLFSALAPGNYNVQFILPAGYLFSMADQGTDDAKDSDANPATGLTACTTLEPGETDLTWDAGLYVRMGPGTGTPGYWMNHPEAWPVETIVIGGRVYTRDQAIVRMKSPVRKDKRGTMFPALVCAKLNLLIGNDSSCIASTISAADAWYAAYGGSVVLGSSAAWRAGEPLYKTLDAYNNGLLCAPHRD
jgi:hypothetical protein